MRRLAWTMPLVSWEKSIWDIQHHRRVSSQWAMSKRVHRARKDTTANVVNTVRLATVVNRRSVVPLRAVSLAIATITRFLAMLKQADVLVNTIQQATTVNAVCLVTMVKRIKEHPMIVKSVLVQRVFLVHNCNYP